MTALNVYLSYEDIQTEYASTANASILPPSTTLAKWCQEISRMIDSYVGKTNCTTNYNDTPDEFVACAAREMMYNKLVRYLRMKHPDKYPFPTRSEGIEIKIIDESVKTILDFFMTENNLYTFSEA